MKTKTVFLGFSLIASCFLLNIASAHPYRGYEPRHFEYRVYRPVPVYREYYAPRYVAPYVVTTPQYVPTYTYPAPYYGSYGYGGRGYENHGYRHHGWR